MAGAPPAATKRLRWNVPLLAGLAATLLAALLQLLEITGAVRWQSLDNLEAIEYGLRMIAAKKRMAQSRLLSVTEAPEPREAQAPSAAWRSGRELSAAA